MQRLIWHTDEAVTVRESLRYLLRLYCIYILAALVRMLPQKMPTDMLADLMAEDLVVVYNRHLPVRMDLVAEEHRTFASIQRAFMQESLWPAAEEEFPG